MDKVILYFLLYFLFFWNRCTHVMHTFWRVQLIATDDDDEWGLHNVFCVRRHLRSKLIGGFVFSSRSPLFSFGSFDFWKRCMCFWKLVQLALFCLKWQIMSRCKSVCFYGDWNERSICRWWYLGTAAAAADVQESIPDARKKRNSQICT